MILLNVVLAFLFISILIIYLLRIEIAIKKTRIVYKDTLNDFALNIEISGMFIGKFRIFKLKINEKNIKNISSNKKIARFLKNRKFDLINLNEMKNLIYKYKSKYDYMPLEIKQIKLDISLQVINLFITNYIVVIMATIFSILFANLENINNQYKINMVNNDTDLLEINLYARGIITINLAHIINIFILYFLERRNANGRKSPNRGINEYSYD